MRTSLMFGTSFSTLGRVAEDRRDHRLGDEVLRALQLDPTAKRLAAVDRDAVDRAARLPFRGSSRPATSVFTQTP